MLRRLRGSFAAKLLAGGLVLAMATIGGVSAYLLLSRSEEVAGAALSNADNRAAVLEQLLVRVTGEQSVTAARGLADQHAVQQALTAPNPVSALTQLFAGGGYLQLPHETLVIVDQRGHVAYAAATLPQFVGLSAAPPALLAALHGRGSCYPALAAGAGTACGLEAVVGVPSFDVAVPVSSGGAVVGAVGYLAPLTGQLSAFQSLIQYPVALIFAAAPHGLVRLPGGASSATPPSIATAIAGGAAPPVHLIYSGPGGAQVAGSFEPVLGPSSRVAAWIGVEAPVQDFSAGTAVDELTLSLISLLALLIVAIAVIWFVERVVHRPLRRLEQGVARIAEGDYASAVEVGSGDELGRLAVSVNQMRMRIANFVGEVQEAHERLDRALTQVSDVSRALTGTGLGVAELEAQVVRTAAALGGGEAAAWLAERKDQSLTVRAVAPAPGGDEPAPPSHEAVARLLAGERVLERSSDPPRQLLAVPMFLQGEVVGAMGVVAPLGASLAAEQDVVSVLAGNAAIARENARLFDQERETVERLRQLDTMKTEFLSTVQHELRTPLTAILGLSDLAQMCWATWDETTKKDALRDIEVAARNLHDMVETILDFSLFEEARLEVQPDRVPLRTAVEHALAAVGERYREGIAREVRIDVPGDLQVLADPARFDRVLRAILDNAVKFSEAGTQIMITARRIGGRRALLTVEDHGSGIAPEALPHVFERFYQAEPTLTRRHGGAGMGLALVRRLADVHGARVEVRSREGEGTVVSLEWPEAAPSEGTPAGEDGPPTELQLHGGRRRRSVERASATRR
jgi:signal transduction histidine kinase